MTLHHSSEDRISNMLAHLHSAEFAEGLSTADRRSVRPFVTISRQAWAGGMTLADALVKQLNSDSSDPLPWTCWDRELVEKIATEHKISESLIESLEESDHSWLADFFGSLSFTNNPVRPDELTIFHRVAQTIRALAAAGNVVIVGRGGVHITRGMPGGVHVRLVAPIEYRVGQLASRLAISPRSAAEQIARIDRNREAFYHRYFPKQPIVPELFTVTLNAALLDERQMVDCLTTLIAGRQRHAEVSTIAVMHGGDLS